MYNLTNLVKPDAREIYTEHDGLIDTFKGGDAKESVGAVQREDLLVVNTCLESRSE